MLIINKEHLYNDFYTTIKNLAFEVCKTFNCYEKNTNHTRNIIDELISVGTVSFFSNIDNYDSEKAKLTTFMYPYIKGDMYRYMEKNVGSLSLTKNEMEEVRKVQKMYYSDYKSIDEIANELKFSVDVVQKHIGYNTHSIPAYSLLSEDDDRNVFDIIGTSSKGLSAEKIVYKRICIELLKELFLSLPIKEQTILGKYYGAFVYEKYTLEQIALDEMMRVDGVLKAKNKALEHLRKKYKGSKLNSWRIINRILSYY